MQVRGYTIQSSRILNCKSVNQTKRHTPNQWHFETLRITIEFGRKKEIIWDRLDRITKYIIDRSKKDDTQASSSTVNNASDLISRLDISTVVEPEIKLPLKQLDVSECTCGMPLCICEAPVPSPVPIPAKEVVTTHQDFNKHSCLLMSSQVYQ